MGRFHFNHVIVCYNDNFKDSIQSHHYSKKKNAIIYEIYIWSEEGREKKLHETIKIKDTY